MNGPSEQTRTNSSSQSGHAGGGSGAAFQFDRGDDWVRMSADFGRLREVVGEQVRKAVADINVNAIAEEVRRTLTDVVNEVRQAMDTLSSTQPWSGPTRVRVDIHAESASEQPAGKPTEDLSQERMTILNLVAQGKITVEEASVCSTHWATEATAAPRRG